MKALRPLIGAPRQLASLRRITLEDGAEAGVRALLFSSGGGLDLMVLESRTLDIGTLHYRGVPVAWQSAAGFRHPALLNPDIDGGRGFERGLTGFLVTCGLEHIRQPKHGAPLHGRLPFTPARLTASTEDWEAEEPILACEGEVVQLWQGREALRLRRRIEVPVGGTALRLRDQVTNIGGTPAPLHLLYHMNLGYPAVRPGARVSFDGAPVFGPLDALPSALMAARCYPARGQVADCRFETAEGFRLGLTFAPEELPFLQLWADLRSHAGVFAIEPCTSDRMPDGTSGPPMTLEPGETRRFGFGLELSGPAPAIAPARAAL